MKHLIRPDHPIDASTLKILEEVKRAADAIGVNYCVVGATARDILLTHVFGMATRRATVDIDFAIAFVDWSQFENIKNSLIKIDGFSASSKMVQRLYFGENDAKNEPGIPIDLIPFGVIEHPIHKIIWPPDMQVMMDVTGYQEVYDAAEEIQFAASSTVRVASLAGLVVLKLFAWKDRGNENPKDAQDFHTILNSYADAGNLDRIYDDETNMLQDAGYAPELAAATLLGRDVAKISNNETYSKLMEMSDPGGRHWDRLILDMVGRNRYDNARIGKCEILLKQFVLGMRDH